MKISNSKTEEVQGFLSSEGKLNGEVPEEHLDDWEEHATFGYNNDAKISLSRKLLQNTPSDEGVLLQFKQAIMKDPSGVLRGWNISANADYCQWRGVTCDPQTKRVIGLNITGEEFPEINNLTYFRCKTIARFHM